MGAVLGVAKLFIEHLHDSEVDVVANEVGQRERAHRMVGSEHHALIDILCGCDAVSQDADCLVDHRNEDAVDNKSGCFFYGYRLLTNLLAERYNGACDCFAGELAIDDLYELHAVSGVEEMATDHLGGALGGSCNLGDGERGAVGGEDGLRLADTIEFAKHLFLERHILHCCFDYEVSVSEGGVVRGGGDVGQDGSFGLLGHLSFFYEFGIALLYRSHRLIQAGLGARFHDNGHFGSKGFYDTFSHCTRTDYIDFHEGKWLSEYYFLCKKLSIRVF